MLICNAGGQTRVRVRAWFGENGTGFLDLFKKQNGSFALIGSNPGAEAELDYRVPPEMEMVELCVRAFNANIGGEPRRVYLELSQNDHVLPVFDGDVPVNGEGPYREFRLSPDAPHNLPKFYYFNVRFA